MSVSVIGENLNKALSPLIGLHLRSVENEFDETGGEWFTTVA